MKAIVRSLIWEFMAHHTWMVLTMLVAANALPLLVISALSGLRVDLNSPELGILPLALIPYAICAIACGVMISQGSISRMYLKPVSNQSLTLLFLGCGGLFTLLGVGGSLGFWRLLFDLQWPLWRPMLLTLALWFAIHPSLRVNAKSPLRVAEIIAIVIFFWFWSKRFQASGAGVQLAVLSQAVSVIDVLLALAMIAYGYVMTLRRLADDRCGKAASGLAELVKQWTLRWDRAAAAQHPFSGARQAYLWYEWTLRGKPLIICLLTIILLSSIAGVLGVLFGEQTISQALADIREAFAPMILLHIALAGLVGFFAMLLDEQSLESAHQEDRIEISRRSMLGEFRAALPLTDLQIARAIQGSILKTNLLAIGLLFSCFAIIYGISFIVGITWNPNELDSIRWCMVWVVVGLGSWAAMASGSILAFLGASDRRWFAGLFALLFCLVIVAEVNWQLTFMSVAAGCVLVTAWSFYTAWRQRLLSGRLAICSLLCAAFAGFAAWRWIPGGLPSELLVWMVILATATLLPLSAIPQVVSASRHT